MASEPNRSPQRVGRTLEHGRAGWLIVAYVSVSVVHAGWVTLSLPLRIPYNPMDVFVAITFAVLLPIGILLLPLLERAEDRKVARARRRGVAALVPVCMPYGIAGLFPGWHRSVPILAFGIFGVNRWMAHRIRRARDHDKTKGHSGSMGNDVGEREERQS